MKICFSFVLLSSSWILLLSACAPAPQGPSAKSEAARNGPLSDSRDDPAPSSSSSDADSPPVPGNDKLGGDDEAAVSGVNSGNVGQLSCDQLKLEREKLQDFTDQQWRSEVLNDSSSQSLSGCSHESECKLYMFDEFKKARPDLPCHCFPDDAVVAHNSSYMNRSILFYAKQEIVQIRQRIATISAEEGTSCPMNITHMDCSCMAYTPPLQPVKASCNQQKQCAVVPR